METLPPESRTRCCSWQGLAHQCRSPRGQKACSQLRRPPSINRTRA
jgi:hypothetical protein